MPYDPDLNETSHAATERQKCFKMADKYNWRLRRIEVLNQPIVKYDCIFEGKAEFPQHWTEAEDED